MKTRREFLAASATLALSASTKKLQAIGHIPQFKTPTAPGAPTASATLAVSTTRTHTIPKNFIGLSYESQELTDPHFFSPKNGQLIAQFKALSPTGVLRIGGNTSEFSWWQPTPDAVMPPRANAISVAGEPSALSYPITPAAVDNLAKFLKATGWTCIYGLNLGNGSPTLDTAEAEYAAKALGAHLEYFQIGNEVDDFSRHLRDPKTWNPQTYFVEWLAIARAVTEKVPNAQFGAPDVASHPEWLTAFATSILAMENPPRIAALSHHHYVGGPPSSPEMTIAHILGGSKTDPAVDRAAAAAQAAAAQIKTSYRMTEGNTCYRGGKPGVSDVFAASLWSADYLLHLASLGYAGVNLHGGDAQMVANSLGGTLPGELLMKNPNEPHPKPFYTPIANINGTYTAEPVFYGMLFAQQFAGATLLDVDLNTTFVPANAPGQTGVQPTATANATAFAAIRPDGKTIIAVINKDLTNDLNLHITGAYASSILRLAAPAIDSHDVTFAGATVTANGLWNPHPNSAIIYYGHNAPIRIPKASAAFIVCH